MKILLDSNVYISLFSPHEITHEETFRCFQFFHQHDEYEMILARLVIFEVMSALLIKAEGEKNMRDAVHIMKKNAQQEIIELTEDLEEIFFLHCGKLRLKTSDLLITLSAFEDGAILITWDKILLREAKKIIRCYTPIEFMALVQKGNI